MTELALIARQPIFDTHLNVHGYELLYRDEENALTATFDDESFATSNVIVNTFVELGLDRVVGNKKAYINLGRELLLQKVVTRLPPDKVVIEVLETARIDDELEDSLAEHVEAGFDLALDDYEYSVDSGSDRLIKLARVIKLDVMALGTQRVAEHVNLLRAPGVKLLAEKVETQEEFEIYKAMGFDYFQGYFFARPTILSTKKLSPDTVSTMSLLAQLQNPNVEIDDIDDIVKPDVSLSYKLLRYINSAHFNLQREIEHVRDALVYLGVEPIKQWITLFILAGATRKSSEMVTTALVRAYMCEHLGKSVDAEDASAWFTAGLFSALDVLLDSDMETVLAELPLASSLKAAIQSHEGKMGEALACTLAIEQWNEQAIRFDSLSHGSLTELYVDALSQSMSITDTLIGP